jgi:hypothetical protein
MARSRVAFFWLLAAPGAALQLTPTSLAPARSVIAPRTPPEPRALLAESPTAAMAAVMSAATALPPTDRSHGHCIVVECCNKHIGAVEERQMLMLRLSPAVADEPLLESSDCHIWLHLELKKEFVCHRVRDENGQRRHVLSVAKHRERRTSATSGVSWRGGGRQSPRRYSAHALPGTVYRVLCSSLRKLRVWTLFLCERALTRYWNEFVHVPGNVVHMYIHCMYDSYR